MSKRFIDTELFEDEWFMDLSCEGKVAFVYFITKCNHAGILDLNKKLFEFQAGVKWVTVSKDLGNRLVRVKENLYFMPKYLEYQYPNFPNSKVIQQKSALDLLKKYNLTDVMVNEPLKKGYDNDNEYDNESELSIKWKSWKLYKKDAFKFTYKNEHSEKAARSALMKLAKDVESDAITIINNSMANGWKGFFALKNAPHSDAELLKNGIAQSNFIR